MQKIWERRADENTNFYNFFNCFLENDCNIEKTAQKLKKSLSYLRNLAARFNWRERGAAFNESLIDDARAELKSKLVNKLLQQWTACDELQDSAISALRAKDLTKASFKSLNEIYHSAAQLQLKIFAEMKLFEPSKNADDKNLTIRIIPAQKKDAATATAE